MNDNLNESLRAAITLGDPKQVAALIRAGADVHYRDENGYDALINAAYGQNDSCLIEMLTLLVTSGVSLTGMSICSESAVRVLSRLGRFDAVQFLLKAGANPTDVELTELMKAVAFGTVADVEEVIGQGVDLEARDYCERTAWLIAIQTGDIFKAQYLLEHGADIQARGRCGKPPLFYAIESTHLPTLKWLLEIGADVNQINEFGGTPLIEAAGYDNEEAVEILLKAGANINHKSNTGTALSDTSNRAILLRLLEAGADPQELSSEGRRAILGFSSDPDTTLLTVPIDEFRRFHSPRFGIENPEQMNNPFWESMIRSGMSAYQAEVQVEGKRSIEARYSPVWCAQRYGQSFTILEDGRIIQVAGEHEDSYDRDFCIYNDVFVYDPGGNITIYGYPGSLFPPTDFHTATLIGDHIYLIGSLGYQGTRQFGETPVYRLNVNTFKMERLYTSGHNPGWIYKHQAIQSSVQEIQITGGKIVTKEKEDELAKNDDNTTMFTLNIENLVWAINDPQLP